MFKISKTGQYSWPVSFVLPGDGGIQQKHNFDAIFKRISQSELQALIGLVEKEDGLTDVGFCKKILVGWKGIVDDSGEEIPFSESAMDAVLDTPMLAKAIVLTYMESVSGAKRKN